jgi:hypothetical protein
VTCPVLRGPRADTVEYLTKAGWNAKDAIYAYVPYRGGVLPVCCGGLTCLVTTVLTRASYFLAQSQAGVLPATARAISNLENMFGGYRGMCASIIIG